MWLYYNDLLEKELLDRQRFAIDVMSAVSAGSPADSRKMATAQQRQWKKFLDSLDPKKIKRREKDRKMPLKSLAKIKEIPIMNIPK